MQGEDISGYRKVHRWGEAAIVHKVVVDDKIVYEGFDVKEVRVIFFRASQEGARRICHFVNGTMVSVAAEQIEYLAT
ncbi:hypothetical protein EPA93_35035 [Ktedonosporobacter rubrisoli]|uniref:Uncharacterized protein n=1 Tax=Ktedonosporobacter rubrisoli TaxID=2509675 RepID=A0A4P6K0I0_KTERU|nr:hypothetical protein [Ktedonosporobacter rubrisoli]QBD80906.1 hypothetical protein EPA93_35035 [Ktedonosporobacter rubrisoli]